MLGKLRNRAIYAKTAVALFMGLRRGELLALQWSRVGLDGTEIDVREALKVTKAH